MDINEYTLNTEYGTPDSGLIFFRGKKYTPAQIQQFADELAALADLAESYLPEEETREYKEKQAYYAHNSYQSYKDLYYTLPISRYKETWEADVAAGRECVDYGDWSLCDADRLTQVKQFIKEYEEAHGTVQ